ncbi:MAG: condensation domain-containing protein, partial [Dehalococcoidia bacterium]
HHQQPPTLSDLRGFLKEKLPEYMLPSVFVMLDALPLTLQGKVDRLALPAPDWARPELEESFVAPRTPVEEVLAGIWADVLRLERVGIHDNFFELGGHSLLAMQVISRVRSAFQVESPLRSLFESPTVAGLAERIEMARGADRVPQALPLLPASRDGDLPLSFAQQRLWFLEQWEPNSSIYNVPVALRLTGPLNVAALEQSLNEISRRHEALRTTFSVVDGQPAQVIAPKLNLTLPVLDLRELTEIERDAEVQRLVVEEAQAPFDLAQGPLLRASLLRLGQEEHVLMLTMHHVVSDGWSLNVLFRETTTLYQAFSTGEPSPLPEIPIQYADFALWQRQWLQGEELESQLAYWKEQLDGIPPVLELPTDRPRPAVETFRGAQQFLLLPDALTRSLKALSQREEVTLFMTLLAAFQTLLHRYTGQDDILVGFPIANRNRAEIEGLIGFFVNTLVLRTDLSGEPTFRELLGRVREVALDAYTHQDLPFEKLVAELHPERDISRNPLFQVIFQLFNTSSMVEDEI